MYDNNNWYRNERTAFVDPQYAERQEQWDELYISVQKYFARNLILNHHFHVNYRKNAISYPGAKSKVITVADGKITACR